MMVVTLKRNDGRNGSVGDEEGGQRGLSNRREIVVKAPLLFSSREEL